MKAIDSPSVSQSLLDAREERWRRRIALSERGAVLTLTLNLPGPDKLLPRWLALHAVLRNDFERALADAGFGAVQELHVGAAGPEVHFAKIQAQGGGVRSIPPGFSLAPLKPPIDSDVTEAATLKRAAVDFEERHPAGRLADIDVMVRGEPVGREALGLPPRRCLCCSRPAAECAGRARHSLSEVLEAAERFLEAALPDEVFLFSKSRETAELAVRSLLAEAALDPKPGLVTPYSDGSHRDMNFRMFVDSAFSLSGCFAECAAAGEFLAGFPPEEVFSAVLREAGLRGERAMYRVTGGVNTHKGAIFLLGLLCAAAGRAGAEGNEKPSPEALARAAASFARGLVKRELAPLAASGDFDLDPAGLTARGRAYAVHGLTGARGEAEGGYPLALAALSFLRARRARMPYRAYKAYKKALADTFFFIVSRNGDTNLCVRGGIEGLEAARELAAEVLRSGGASSPEGRAKICLAEKVFAERNLSPGGSADILSSALFLDGL